MDQLSVAVVGLRFGRTWMNGFANHPSCRVACLCDTDPNALAQSQAASGIDATRSHLDQVLADRQIDAVALFTPAPLHAEQSAAALRADKHVLCAVPAATTEQGCRDIALAAKESGRVYMMAENWPYEPSVRKAQSLFSAGRLGSLFYGDRGSFETARGKQARFVARYWSLGDEPREIAEETCTYPPLPDYVEDMGGHAGPAVGIIDDFVQAILDGTTAPIGPILAAHMTLPGICAVQSIQSGQRVEIPDPQAWIDA